MERIWKILKKPLVAAPILLAIVAILVVVISQDEPALATFQIKRENLISLVSVTGLVKPARGIDLAFLKGGRLSWLGVQVGQSVEAGALLARLENADLAAQLAEARARLAAEEARLRELKSGPRPEELALYQANTEKARSFLFESRLSLLAAMRDAFTKSDDAIRNKADQMFSNPTSANPRFLVNFDTKARLELEDLRWLTEGKLLNLGQLIQNGSVSSDLISLTQTFQSDLTVFQNFAAKLGSVINSLTTSSEYPKATIDAWRADVSSARDSLALASSALAGAREKMVGADSQLLVAERELALKSAGPTAEALKIEEAVVAAAGAAAANLEALYRQTFLVAPFSGLITKKHFEVGEIVSAGTPAISLISSSDFEIESYIPEVDIGSVKVGQEVRVTLDAYPGENFLARVKSLEPAETARDGVSTYLATLEFLNKEAPVRSGLTANLEIVTAEREAVLAVPARAIIERDGEKIVRGFSGQEVQEINVATGLRGAEGLIEIISGLAEGDEVAVSQGR